MHMVNDEKTLRITIQLIVIKLPLENSRDRHEWSSRKHCMRALCMCASACPCIPASAALTLLRLMKFLVYAMVVCMLDQCVRDGVGGLGSILIESMG